MYAWLVFFLIPVGLGWLLSFASFFSPKMRCRAMGREHPCRRKVKGFFGRCHDHDYPGLGGRRRICKCDGRMEFRRDYETGRPFLGCSKSRCTQTIDL